MAIGDIARQIFGISKPEFNDKVKYPAVTRGELIKYDELLSQEQFPSIFMSIEMLANDTIQPSGAKTVCHYLSCSWNDIYIDQVPNPSKGKIIVFSVDVNSPSGLYLKYSTPTPGSYFPTTNVDPGTTRMFIYINGYWLFM